VAKVSPKYAIDLSAHPLGQSVNQSVSQSASQAVAHSVNSFYVRSPSVTVTSPAPHHDKYCGGYIVLQNSEAGNQGGHLQLLATLLFLAALFNLSLGPPVCCLPVACQRRQFHHHHHRHYQNRFQFQTHAQRENWTNCTLL